MRGSIALLLLALGLGAAAALLGMRSLALLAPVFVAACIAWPAAGMAALVVACALDRVAIGIGGPNVRPDELCALALAVAIAARLWWARYSPSAALEYATARRSPSPASGRGALDRRFPREPEVLGSRAVGGAMGWGVGAPRIPLLAPMLAYWGVNVLATLAAGGDLTHGASLDLITLDLVVLYAALVAYLAMSGRLMGAVYLWLGVAAAEAIVGALAFALYHAAHGAVPGVQLSPDTGAPMVYGTLYEANIFGSYMSAAFLLALALVADETVRRKAPLYLVCALAALGLVLSATRSAWGSTAICIVLLVALLQVGRGGLLAGRAVRLIGGLVAVAIIVGVGLAVAPASVTGPLGARFQGLLNFGSGSGYGRLQLYSVALDEWKAHPWLGLGPGSFSYRLPGDTSSGPAWLPNLTLQVLHDTGVIGLLALVWLITAFYVTTIRALRRAPAGAPRAALAGLIAGVTSLLIDFQLTPGYTLGYSWALLALAVGAAGTVTARSRTSGRSEEIAA